MIRLLVRGAGGVMVAASVASTPAAAKASNAARLLSEPIAAPSKADAPGLDVRHLDNLSTSELAGLVLSNLQGQISTTTLGWRLHPSPWVTLFFSPRSDIDEGVCKQVSLQTTFESDPDKAGQTQVDIGTASLQTRYWWSADATLVTRPTSVAADKKCAETRPSDGGASISTARGARIAVPVVRAALSTYAELSTYRLESVDLHSCGNEPEDYCGVLSFRSEDSSGDALVPVEHAQFDTQSIWSDSVPVLLSNGLKVLQKVTRPSD